MRRSTSWGLLGASALAVLLAASPLSRDYTDLSYLPELVLAILVAFACGWGARRLDVPTALTPAVSFIGLVELLTLLYFRKHAFGGILPTPAVFAEAGRAVRTAIRDIYTLASPVEAAPELVMLTIAGVYAAAVIVDLVVFRSRHAVAAGLPLLALFIVPSSLSTSGAGWLNFTLAAAGYLVLLAAEGRERVRRWGRRLEIERPSLALGDAAPIYRVARSIGAASIGLALVVPLMIPGLGHGLLTGRGASIGGKGPQSGSDGPGLVDPLVNLLPSLRSDEITEVLRVYTDASQPQYLRQVVLDQFNGQLWSPGYARGKDAPDATSDIPLPPGLSTDATATEPYSARIAIDKNASGSFLPLPYSPTKIDNLDGTWRYHEPTRTVYSPTKNARGSDYTVQSVVPAPEPGLVSESRDYPPEVLAQAAVSPALLDPTVRVAALRITRGATSPWDKAVALQDHFARTGGYIYDLKVRPGSGRDALRNFLTTKRGYCEQYAGAMAAMARAVGLPARVIVGYTPGTRKGDYYSVTNRDAHAWPEIYFVDAGWVRFEPTPPTGGEGVSQPDYAEPSPEVPEDPNATPTPDTESSAGPDVPRNLRDENLRLQQPAALPPDGSDDSGAPPGWLLGLLAVLLLAPLVPAAVRVGVRRWQRSHVTDDAARAHLAWRQLEDDAADLGFAWPASESPRAAARTLVEKAELSGPPVDAVGRLARAAELARYSPTAGPSAGLYDDVVQVRRALLTGRSRRDKWLAVLLPRSARQQLAESVGDGYVRARRTSETVRAQLLRRISPRTART